MEVLNFPTRNKSQILSGIPTFCHVKTLNQKFPTKYHKPSSRFYRKSFPVSLSISTCRSFQIWAHFGRPNNRRNSLRKKLLDDQQVRLNQNLPVPNSELQNLSSSFSDIANLGENSKVNVVEEVDAGKEVSVDNVAEKVRIENAKSKLLGESVMLTKLESWVDQYKKDIEYWGIGSGPIFTVYQDSLGKVKKVSVDEGEILRRSQVEHEEISETPEVNNKILSAKSLAREMENGNNVIPKNSSIAKFVVQGEEAGFFEAIRGFTIKPELLPKLSRVGSGVLFVFVVLWAVKKLFIIGDKEDQYTELEKEMMRRKIKSRKEKEMLVKGTVEVIPEPSGLPMINGEKPKLDKEELRNSILKAKASDDKIVVQGSTAMVTTKSMNTDNKIQEIREMARRARELERRDHSVDSRDRKIDDTVIEEPSNEMEVVKMHSEEDICLSNLQNEIVRQKIEVNATLQKASPDVTEDTDNAFLHEVVSIEGCDLHASSAVISDDRKIDKQEIEFTESTVHPKDKEDNQLSDAPPDDSCMTKELSVHKKPRVIRSLKEARDYLSKKHHEQYPELESKTNLVKDVPNLKCPTGTNFGSQRDQMLEMKTKSDTLVGTSDSEPAINSCEDSNVKNKEFDLTNNESFKGSELEYGVGNRQKSQTSLDHEVNSVSRETRLSENVANLKCPNDTNFGSHKDQMLEMRTMPSKNDTFVGTLESEPAINSCEDSNVKDKEFDLTKNDNFKGPELESGVGNCQKSQTSLDHEVDSVSRETRLSENVANLKCPPDTNFDSQKDQMLEMKTIASKSDTLVGTSDSEPAINSCEDSNVKDNEFDLTRDENFKGSELEYGVGNWSKSQTSLDPEVNSVSRETNLSEKTENWLEQNFHEVEPIIKKIRAGFRDNYMAAKEKVGQPLDINTEMELAEIDEMGGEFDWMQDDHLRDIVFQVRENELAGRDPFYLMEDKDKEAFFRGLEKNVEKENKKLSYLHEWLHSNIENLDYGTDGISLYDPPEKIIPRWRGPPVEKIPEVLNDFLEQKKKNSTRNLLKKDQNGFAKKPVDSSSPENVGASISTCDPKNFPNKNSKSPKTVIEGSDGSVKAGKKSGKEFWQHTKKWSQGFLDCYNAETDPEVKSIMKDIGKDLDRWVTEEEIKEGADLMKKLPDKNRSVFEKKLNKIKREMELFGPQAVVSKYREYADEKEEDYLWWLDLPYVLCIEMYTIDNGEERVGFYSLEMASDLELEPKPYHVIAFQDSGDCKNLCYIIQAHMDMLGNGHAFVVARPPKDAFREAKANGFAVTVIKKGELRLNIDQPLEEVEEQITEIGSKMYHDMIMKERSVDISSMMKGVFGFSGRPTRSKRSKRKLKNKKQRKR